MMLNCKEATQLISQSLDQPLTWSNRLKLKFHLLLCDACTRFNQQLHQLRHLLTNMIRQTENDSSIHLSEEAKSRIIEHMKH
jgi:hypothetical protein